jgi:hypothetical protein
MSAAARNDAAPVGCVLRESLTLQRIDLVMRRRWVQRELDSRALTITRLGYRELSARFGWSPNPDTTNLDSPSTAKQTK